jgi:hypothetical protein
MKVKITIFLVIMMLLTVTCCVPSPALPTKTSSFSIAAPKNITLHERLEAIPANAQKMLPGNDIYPPVLHSNMYEIPVPLSDPITTAGAEDSPFILPDGKTLYFFFTPDVKIPPEKQLLDGVTGIYQSVKTPNGNWSKPERVILNDDIALDGAEFVQSDTLWFCSARPGYSGINWFTAKMINGQWRNWEYSGGQFPASYEVGELHFTVDGQELYYHSLRAGGKGGYDIWMTRKIDGKWQEPVNIEAVNTADNEGWPCISPDGNELWFNGTYMGTPAVFRSVKVNGNWTKPELIISQFAGEPSVDSQGNIYFVHHFYKDSVMLEADIYVAKKK